MRREKIMEKKRVSKVFLGTALLMGALILAGCKLTINSFLAPDTADTGTVITLTFEGYAEDIGDDASTYGLVLQIPQDWQVLSAKAQIVVMGYPLTEDITHEASYTAEPGYKVWVGTSTASGGGSQTVTATVKVLVADFTGIIGETRNFTVKAAAGVYRDGAWTTDDPEGEFEFGKIAGEPYVEDIMVTKVSDETAPATVSTLTVTDQCNGSVELDWSAYDEGAQGDVVKYNIYQDTTSFTDVSAKTPIDTVPLGTFSYLVPSLSYGLEYFFAVTAVDELDHENSEVMTQSIIPLESGGISGRITIGNEYGEPLEGIWINVYDHYSGSYVTDTSTNPDGTYAVSDVCAGTYRVEADGGEIYATEWYDDQCDYQDADIVTVEGGQITSGIDFMLAELCQADFDDDGDVDGLDMAVFASEAGRADCRCAGSGAMIFSTSSDEVQELQNEVAALRTELAKKERRLETLMGVDIK
jgi:hypothetical protein